MEPNSNGHIHKFKRILKKGKKTSEFGCTHPHCSFTRQADYLVGKAAACGYCEKEFIISRFDVNRHGILHCKSCGKGKKKPTDNLEANIEQMLKGVV